MKRPIEDGATLKALVTLASSSWHNLWCPGGAVRPQIGYPSGVYAGDVVIETHAGLISLTGKAVTVEPRSERFALEASLVSEVGTPASERFFQPPRALVNVVPRDFDLPPVMAAGTREIELLLDTDGEPLLAGVVFNTGGHLLAFWADEGLPESLAATSDRSMIFRLKQRYQVETLGESAG